MADVVDPTGEAAAGTMVGEGPGTGGDDFSQFVAGSKQQPQPQFDSTGDINVMSEWVPGEIPTHATQYGPDERHLVYGVSAAVSPNLSAGHDLHEPFEVYDPQGNLVGTYSYDDHSYYSPDNPTYNSIERYGLPALGRGYSIKWLGQGANDFSQYVAQPKEEEETDFSKYVAGANVPRGTMSDEDDFSKYVVKKPEEPPQKSLGDRIGDIWKVQQLGQAKARYSYAAQAANEPAPPDQIVESQIAAINESTMSPEDKAKNIAVLRQRQQEEIRKTAADIGPASQNLAQAQAEVDKAKPGAVESFLGGTLNYAPSMATSVVSGPLGALLGATQATAEEYGGTLNDAFQKGKKAHPDWTDEQAMHYAIQAAHDSARGSGGAMLALSYLDIPTAGPLLSRLAQKFGAGAVLMNLANTAALIQRNMSIKQNVDPKQEWDEGLHNIAFYLQNTLVGGVTGALGEAGRGEKPKPAAEPPKEETKILEVEQPKVEAVPEQKRQEPEPAPEQQEFQFTPQEQPETIRAAAIRHTPTGKVTEGFTHYDAAVTAERSKDPDNYEIGFTTNKGRFVDRDEAHRIAKAAKQIGKTEEERLAAEDLGRGRLVPEQPSIHEADPHLSSIANRFTQERAARGEFDEVAPGEGYATEDLLAMGSRMRPEEVAQHISNLVNGVGGDPVRQAAAVRAREAQLAAASNRASRVWEDDPANMEKKAAADEARDALSQFHSGPIAKMKNQWHGIGMSMQGELPFDLGTFNGQRDKWLKEVGSEPSPKVQEKMRKMAKDVRDTDAEQKAAQEDLGREIQKQPGKSRISEEELHRYLDDVLKDLPCREE